MERTIGPKQTTTTRGGKTTIRKTRYVSEQNRAKRTPGVGEKGWGRGNRKRPVANKSNVPSTPNKPGTSKSGGTTTKPGTQYGEGYWKNVRRWRRMRRGKGARYNLSVTPGQLKATTSRRLS